MRSPRRARIYGSWLIAALASCTSGPAPGFSPGAGDAGAVGDLGADANDPERCAAMVDSDVDGLPNDRECALGTDPYDADTDGDGMRDGREVDYPRACVAGDRAAQRRPSRVCVGDGDCAAGETCVGLDPAARDSDGDGVRDGDEDLNADGVINEARGETDPRLWDTDGDGRSDGDGGLDICRAEGLATPDRSPLGATGVQVAREAAWRGSPARSVAGMSGAEGLLLDDVAAGVAGAVVDLAGGDDVRAEAERVEGFVSAAMGVPVLVGQRVTTHEELPAVTSLYRVAAGGSAGALRDRVAAGLLDVDVAAGGPAYPEATALYVEVTTVARPTRGRVTALVAVAPVDDYDDPSRPTGIRARDLTNTTGLADSTRDLDFRCQRFSAGDAPMVDFLWLVDTSGSMSDDQERLGNTAVRFFNNLNGAGVDFRVGVLTAGSSMLNLDAPGFRFISGASPTGARDLAWEVTTGAYMGNGFDNRRPYAFAGGMEEPLAAGVISYETFLARAQAGETNPDRRFRFGSSVVMFFVTDEAGTNDVTRYFGRDIPRWGGDGATQLGTITEFFQTASVRTFGMVNDFGTSCSRGDQRDLPKCVILANGGAFIPITTATDAEVTAAMLRIVDGVAGSTSAYALDRTPVSSTLRVTVRGQPVPRSRAEGFDYDAASRAIVFYGGVYRPHPGDAVVVSYRVWVGSVG
ncbi:MAG: hypothetical protein R3A52_25115 [Polyangiales bacterium]